MKITTTLLAVGLVLVAHTASATPFSYDCDGQSGTLCDQSFGPDPVVFTSTFNVAESGTIADLNLLVDITHTFSGDLDITLEHDGTSVELAGLPGGAADHVLGTDYGTLGAFAGLDIFGTWNLEVEDTFFGDAGVLSNWTISGDLVMEQVPVPATLALLGLGLGVLGWSRRKKA